MSGQYSSFAAACLQGIRLALAPAAGEPVFFRTVVVDTHGSAADAAAAYARAVADPSTIAVLGPMLAWEVQAVEGLASQAGLATVSFSQTTIPVGGPFFRFSMTKEDQAVTLAGWAIGERGLRRVAIFFPEDPFGREMAALFREMAERLGGHVVAAVGYDPTKVDFADEVKQLRGALGAAEGQPPAVDAILIPDSAEKAVMIAPQLAFFDFRGVQLLGTHGWNRLETLRKGLPQTEGAVFVDGFFVHSFLPSVRSFIDAYRDAYDGDPSILAAYGYDGARFLRDGFERGARDRASLRGVLGQPHGFAGATGMVRVGDGRLERRLFLLRFENGTVRELSPGVASGLPAGAP
jgi:ABC-type branched-subunit amino acid transport system substrate-binding protein